MDKRDRLKIVGAIAGSIAVALVIGWFSGVIYPVSYPSRSAYTVPDMAEPVFDVAAVQRHWPTGDKTPGELTRMQGYMADIRNAVVPVSADAGAQMELAPQPVADLGTLLTSADLQRGQQISRTCQTCHSFEQGGRNMTGPDLWGVVGRKMASVGSFTYSTAMKTQTGDWTYDRLFNYLANPQRAIPGNKMAFAGIRNATDRAAMIAYIASLNPGSPAFPKPNPVQPSTDNAGATAPQTAAR